MNSMRERAEKIIKEHVSALELDAPRWLQMREAITSELMAVWNEAVEKCAKIAMRR